MIVPPQQANRSTGSRTTGSGGGGGGSEGMKTNMSSLESYQKTTQSTALRLH